jgi:hypothetical protein
MPIPIGTVVVLKYNKDSIGIIIAHKKDKKEQVYCTVKWLSYSAIYDYQFDKLTPLE